MNVNGYEIGPGADFENTDLEGADLSNANLREANLEDANLRGLQQINVFVLGRNMAMPHPALANWSVKVPLGLTGEGAGKYRHVGRAAYHRLLSTRNSDWGDDA